MILLNKNELISFIKVNADATDFTGGVDESKIELIEKKLDVNLPNSYKWFLQTYGMGGIFGVEILGCGKSILPSVVIQTERYRDLGLPKDYVVIENCDEFAFCLVTSKMVNNECPVASWDRIDGFGGERWNTFLEFIGDRLTEAKENLDDY